MKTTSNGRRTQNIDNGLNVKSGISQKPPILIFETKGCRKWLMSSYVEIRGKLR
jgi:hypothetical protein